MLAKISSVAIASVLLVACGGGGNGGGDGGLSGDGGKSLSKLNGSWVGGCNTHFTDYFGNYSVRETFSFSGNSLVSKMDYYDEVSCIGDVVDTETSEFTYRASGTAISTSGVEVDRIYISNQGQEFEEYIYISNGSLYWGDLSNGTNQVEMDYGTEYVKI